MSHSGNETQHDAQEGHCLQARTLLPVRCCAQSPAENSPGDTWLRHTSVMGPSGPRLPSDTVRMLTEF